MVRRKIIQPDMHSTYHLEPGQTLENTKVSLFKETRRVSVTY